ncbi:MAG: competence/damage-inducible protein A [Gemmatimonadaceae bacterium]
MKIELLTIGDELLLGFTVDTNGAWIARELASLGGEIVRRSTVGDDASAIQSAVRDALDRTGCVITTGGLGPTADDLTKPSIGAVFGRDQYFDEAQWERILALWRSRGRPGLPPESNKQQVMLPVGSHVLENPLGTAPGIFLEDDHGRWVAMLPGVPREMRAMLSERLIPLLTARGRLGTGHVVRSRTVRTTGIAESALTDVLGETASGFPDATLAYLPGVEGVDLRLTVRGLEAADAERVLDRHAQDVRERVGKVAYGVDGVDLTEHVLELCRERRLTLAVAESCTGGLLAERITQVPGSSDVFLGGVVSYANDVKTNLLGVSPEVLSTFGAVSGECAAAMASGVRTKLGASIGVALTGIAGPGGGTPEKPVGLVWIALDFGDWSRTYSGRFFISRDEIRFRATQSALDSIRRRILYPEA